MLAPQASARNPRAQTIKPSFTIPTRTSPLNSKANSKEGPPCCFSACIPGAAQSGRRYKLKCALSKRAFPEPGVGGVYVFVRRRFAFFLEPLYVGKAHDLRNRLLGHEKWGRAYWYYGATERYLLYPIRDEVDRRRIEEDLIKGLMPPMNDVRNRQRRPGQGRQARRRTKALV